METLGSAGESSLIGGSFFLSQNPCIFGVVSKPWLALLPLHYDSLELTAETFPSRVLVFRHYLSQELSGYQPLQASTSRQKIQHLPQPTCWNDLVMVAHEICRSPVKALFACRRSPSLLFAANVQVTTITLLPLQHSHLEPSFSTLSNLPCPPCKQLACMLQH